MHARQAFLNAGLVPMPIKRDEAFADFCTGGGVIVTVDGIAAVPTGVVGAFADVPLTDVVIQLAVQTK